MFLLCMCIGDFNFRAQTHADILFSRCVFFGEMIIGVIFQEFLRKRGKCFYFLNKRVSVVNMGLQFNLEHFSIISDFMEIDKGLGKTLTDFRGICHIRIPFY